MILILSFFIYNDYGLAWDEPQQRELGLATYDYVMHGDDRLLQFKDRHYGVAFELPLVIIEKMAGLDDSRDIYQVRHLVSNWFFIIGAVFFFLILMGQYQNPWLALAGASFLLLSPRMFAHSFFNSKDIPFMVMFIINQYTLLKAVKSKPGFFLVHGAVTGLLINIRLMGLFMVAITLVYLLLDFYRLRDRRRFFMLSFLYLTAAMMTLLITWPYLWGDPFHRLLEALTTMQQFPWDSAVLYFGRLIPAPALPWHYIPGWIGISTPILYLALFVTGTSFMVISLSRDTSAWLKDPARGSHLVFLLSFFLPVITVVVLKSVLYDGWRQMYFIYPSLLYLSVYGIYRIMAAARGRTMAAVKDRPIAAVKARTWAGYVMAGVLALNSLCILKVMVTDHPYQHIYFNSVVPTANEYTRHHFEMDYWGTSYRGALEHILQEDRSDTIKILVEHNPGIWNRLILSAGQGRDRIDYVSSPDEADYFITNYRWHPGDYPYGDSWYDIRVMGSSINTTWKFNNLAAK